MALTKKNTVYLGLAKECEEGGGSVILKGVWTATGQTDYSTIPLPATKGWGYLVNGTTTIDTVTYTSGDVIVFNKDVASGATILTTDLDLSNIDMVTKDNTITLTNKTINADNNTLSNVELDNLKSGVVQTTVREVGSATDLALVTEKAVSTALAAKQDTLPSASNTVAGKIRIATDGEATTGTSEVLAVNPLQLATKVTVEAGKGLSSEDYTLAEKNKLAGLGSSSIPFSIKSANIGDKGQVDIFNVSKIVNSGCSFTGAVATGGSGKYVRLLEVAPITSADSWEIKTKYYYNGGGSVGKTILGSSTTVDFKAPALIVGNGGGDNLWFLASSTGATWDLFIQDTGLTLSSGTTYWIILSYDSVTGYKIEYSTNGTDYTTAWSSATVTKCYCNMPFVFLNNMLNLTTYYSAGTMDLSETVITIDSIVWWTGVNVGNTLSFKVDDGTTYAPLKVVNPSGEEVTLTSITALDLSGFVDGIINIFATATGAEARQNNIYMQTSQPVAENDGDVWINGDVVKDWDDSESEYVTSTTIAFLGSVVKNVVIENGYCFPLNYNGIKETSCINYVTGNLEFDIVAKSGFKFYGRYKNYLLGGKYKHPTLFFAFYDTSYNGVFQANYVRKTTADSRDIFSFDTEPGFGNIIVQGYITI